MWVPLLIETFAKTWMNGVFKPSQQPSSEEASEKHKSNIIIQLHYLNTSTSSSTSHTLLGHHQKRNASSLSLSSASVSGSVSLPVLVTGCLAIFFECLTGQLTTVLMNDFRLKTFYCKSSSKTSTSATATSAKPTSTSASASATLTTLSISRIGNKLTPTSNNNHLRTYNNSSKSNKVFLYYTPRDPRLRIFHKTKQLSHRPQCCEVSTTTTTTSSTSIHRRRRCRCSSDNHSNSNSKFSNNSLLKITDDLCNYGELIGGHNYNSGEFVYSKTSGEYTRNINKQEKPKSANSRIKSILNNSNNCDRKSLNKREEKREDLKSDNKYVVVFATADIIFDTALAIIIVHERHLAEFLLALLR